MSEFSIDAKKLNNVMERASRLGERAEETINRVLHGKKVKNWLIDDITELTPRSNRKLASWHPAHAKDSKPYTSAKGNLSITIKTKKQFDYLYFPDDGRTTKSHRGEQFFMLRGAQKAAEKITEELLSEISKAE